MYTRLPSKVDVYIVYVHKNFIILTIKADFNVVF